MLRRQQSSLAPGSIWSNSSIPATATQSTEMGTPSTTPILSPTFCSKGGEIGNFTVNFDDVSTGPLFNPSGNIWFSEGFLIAPPSSENSEPYIASSGGQLVEFVPPSLSHSILKNTGDTAEIGVGPNFAESCFRFNLYSASLGCAAQGKEEWCEFEISAYSFDGTSHEQSIAWSETKRVPACSSFPNSSCPLTPVEFGGYSNITSILIKVHVGLELRVWWGDDFKFGWTDSSCEAAECRAGTTPHRVKRETIDSALSHGVWQWTPSGLEKVDKAYIRGVMH